MEAIMTALSENTIDRFILEGILNGLSSEYNEGYRFNDCYDALLITQYNYFEFIEGSCNVVETGKLSEADEDLVDYAREVHFLRYPVKLKQQFKPLTLRNSLDLDRFELFLDKMIRLDSLNHKKFLSLFAQCPTEYYDKIDDLRETSKKGQRDSVSFTRCLVKAKQVSMSFSNG